MTSHTSHRCREQRTLLDQVRAPHTRAFSPVKPSDTAFRSDGLLDFLLYRDLGIAAVTGGKVLAQWVMAHNAPEKGRGWHRREAGFHSVIMLRGRARFMVEDQETLVNVGDCLHPRPGVQHDLFDHSPAMEALESVGPADFSSVDVPAVCDVPAPKRWGL